MLDEITAAVGASGLLRIYDGVRPVDADAAISTQTLLAELECDTVFAPAATGGVLTANPLTPEASAPAGGVATWFRVVTSGGSAVFDGDVSSVSEGTGDLELPSTTITLGQTVEIDPFTITEGNG